MPAYKWLKNSLVDLTMRGNFRLTRLSKFRLLERVLNDSSIGDDFEGKAVTHIEIDQSRLSDPVYRAMLDTNGFKLRADSTNRISGAIVHKTLDGFVYCATLQKPVTEFERYGQPQFFQYGSCLRIDDIESFSEKLFSEGTIGSGRSLSDVVGRPQTKSVTYVDSLQFNSVGPVRPPDAFLKRLSYAHQREIRAFYEGVPSDLGNIEFLDVHCLAAVDLIHPIQIGGEEMAEDRDPFNGLDIDEAKVELEKCIPILRQSTEHGWTNENKKRFISAYWPLREAGEFEDYQQRHIDHLFDENPVGGTFVGAVFYIEEYLGIWPPKVK